MDLHPLMEKLAGTLIAQQDSIAAIVEELPRETIALLVAECRRQALPGDTKNFPMPEWDRVAEMIEGAYAMRVIFERGAAYMEATGEKFYCVYCGGACKPEHIAMFKEGM